MINDIFIKIAGLNTFMSFDPPPQKKSYISVTGCCVAVADYSPIGQDELPLSRGDIVEIQGVLVRGLGFFIGTHRSTGHTGFVHKAHVKPLDTIPL